jgi:hypothetical protein
VSAPHDRELSTLRPRRELLEALWNLAYWATDRRRRKAGVPKVSILKVNIWVQASQARLIARYRAHLAYLKEPRPISRRTLTRQVAGFRRLKLIAVKNFSDFDRRRGAWVQQHNVYTVTYLGKLWIKRHARSVKIPLVV